MNYREHVIQTQYAGCFFRSRLEARWAVFFDTLGINWEYEPEGYKLKSGNYLPDFWLPDQDCWFEVKGDTPHYLQREKDLAEIIGKMLYISEGPIPYPEPTGDSCAAFYPDGSCDLRYHWCKCMICGKYGLEFDGRSERLSCNCEGHKNKEYTRDHPLIMVAYQTARLERFEGCRKKVAYAH